MTGVLPDLVAAAAREHPGRTAVVDGERVVPYALLHAEASRMARLLVEAGVRPGDRVALYLPKSTEAVVAIHGVLAAGAAYVPLDPLAPPARTAVLLRDSGARCVVVTEFTASTVPVVPPLDTVVVCDGAGRGTGPVRWLGRADLDRCEPVAPAPRIGPDDLAYVLYTSGSTGVPKGVALSHGNALAFVRWAARTCELAPDDRVGGQAPLHFDLSVFDVFATASAAAALVLIPPRVGVFPMSVASLVERAGVTVWYSVPSALVMLRERGDLARRDLSRLRLVAFAGEVFPVPRLRQLMALLPHARFLNFYGPTETNVCTWHEVPHPLPPTTTSIPIGRAITGVSVFAVTDDGHLAAPGETGELHVRGPTVMRGYWNDPDRTGAALVPAPDGGGTCYRTGDLVRHEGDGRYTFLGRRDDQVKIRGNRVEPGEVEVVLHDHPAVADCAVLAVPDADGDLHLVAAVAAPGVDAAELTRHCAERLPRAAVPERFDVLPELPRTPTGKTDRAALRDRAAVALGTPDEEAPGAHRR
ncbi:amino acid adenylation domain-containing protein [Saccharothrix obliqua]|uniref:amino acid adenylation domain-containing protein n=1 Tax=Saccharothrix obliqua TaxID=2861747 RepID=UPI001C5D5D8D|nr:amino acid adenylation domain-containing protein [Saccharothrix obliqua]MBW4718165.1 amino acid adenylation domain-containing protein [Saccharothrix obliqua]